MRQANASLAFIVLVRFYEATDQLRARSPWSDAQSKPSTPKEHGASCLSPQGTDRMNIQTTHSSNRRHSEEQGESRFATPHGSSSRKGAKQPKPMDHLIDRPDCSKLVGTFNLFIPRCSQTGRAPKADFSNRSSCFVVGVTGFEPVKTSGSQIRRSTRLSYTPMCPFASRRL